MIGLPEMAEPHRERARAPDLSRYGPGRSEGEALGVGAVDAGELQRAAAQVHARRVVGRKRQIDRAQDVTPQRGAVQRQLGREKLGDVGGIDAQRAPLAAGRGRERGGAQAPAGLGARCLRQRQMREGVCEQRRPLCRLARDGADGVALLGRCQPAHLAHGEASGGREHMAARLGRLRGRDQEPQRGTAGSGQRQLDRRRGRRTHARDGPPWGEHPADQRSHHVARRRRAHRRDLGVLANHWALPGTGGFSN